jgi:ABC-type multidrug transport system fused ATPase/permease subunit
MTIRDNILYGEEMDKEHYYDTIKLCELERDFEILPAGDLTEIGERGINLSGGQKARIGLARAVYSKKDIYLMDDPISALDAEVRKNIFKNLFFGHLKDKTCVLVTHAIDFLSYAHKVVVMEKGKIITQGTYDKVKDHEIVKKLLEVNNLNKNKVTEKLNKDGKVVQCEQSDQDYESEEEQKEEDEKDESASSEKEKDLTMVPSYTSQDLTKEEKLEKFKTLGRVSKKNDGKCIRDDDNEDIKVGLDTYKKLIELFGGIKYMIMACLVSALLCYLRIKTDYVIAQWGNDFELQKTKYGQFILIVATFALSTLVSESIKSIIMMVLNMRASTDMHNKMIHKIIRAP